MATKSAAPSPKKVTLGSSIDALWALREDKRTAEAAVKLIEEKIAALEAVVMENLEAEGIDASRGKAASVSITSVTSFSIDDFDAFAKYVARTKYFHLFQRRVSEVAVREVFELKGAVPGLAPFTKKKLNLRSLAAKS